MIEIIIHGKAGHGAKSLGEIIASIMQKKGYFIQSFPEYGAAREGAPVKSFVRLDKQPILMHSNIENPNIVIIIDKHLIAKDKTPKNSTIILNTDSKTKDKNTFKINATEISQRNTGNQITNLTMLGSVAKATKLFTLSEAETILNEKFNTKISKETLTANIKAMKESYEKTR